MTVAVVALLCGGDALAEIYRVDDGQGVAHFTNVPQPGARVFTTSDAAPEPVRAGAGTPPADAVIDRYATAAGVEPALVKAVIRAESGFDRHAVSARGARGLMQLMPRTAHRHGCANAFDTEENVRAGVAELRLLLDRYQQNLPRVLAAYNAGSEPVDRYRGIPPYAETQTYVSRVLLFRRQYLREQRLPGHRVSARLLLGSDGATRGAMK